MSKRLCLVLSIILTATTLLAACASAATPATASAAPIQPMTAPAAIAATSTTAAAQPNLSSIKVGLVTDIGGVSDKAFNQLAWEGVQKASKDMGFQAKSSNLGSPPTMRRGDGLTLCRPRAIRSVMRVVLGQL